MPIIKLKLNNSYNKLLIKKYVPQPSQFMLLELHMDYMGKFYVF